MNRLNEIIKRLSEIKIELEKDDADLDSLEKEMKNLEIEKKDIEEKAKKRKELLERVANSGDLEIIKDFKEQRKDNPIKGNVLASKEYRSFWAKSLMGLPLTEAEKRAGDQSLTTTSESYTAFVSGSTDGVNNGGLFIPEEVMMELMNRMELASPFFRDIPKTEVAGLVKFPYRKSGSGASEQTEGVAGDDGQVQWGELTLTTLEVSETIRVTWKLEAMSVDSFIDYIIDELAMAIPEKIANEIFYGDGSGSISGISKAGNFIDGEYTIGEAEGNVADIFEALEEGIKLLEDPRKRLGAKIYVAQDIMDALSFARDSEGRFMHNPINGVGIKSLSKYDIEEDPFLDDGDFVIGNPRYFRFNWNEGLSITKDISGRNRINDYTGYAVVSGAPQPSSFVYGKKSS